MYMLLFILSERRLWSAISHAVLSNTHVYWRWNGEGPLMLNPNCYSFHFKRICIRIWHLILNVFKRLKFKYCLDYFINTVNCFIFISVNFCQTARRVISSVRKFIISRLPERKFVARALPKNMFLVHLQIWKLFAYNREVEQTQLVRVRVHVTPYFVDDVIIICVPRTCSTHYTFAWTCKLWSTRSSLHVVIAIKWRWESQLILYKMVFMYFKNENIQQKRLESTKLITKSDHTLGCWNCIFYTFTYA